MTKARRLVANTMLAARRSDDVRHLFAPLATLTTLQPSNNFVVMGNDATAEVRVIGTALSEVTMASPLASMVIRRPPRRREIGCGLSGFLYGHAPTCCLAAAAPAAWRS